jgi:hypothetical protein
VFSVSESISIGRQSRAFILYQPAGGLDSGELSLPSQWCISASTAAFFKRSSETRCKERVVSEVSGLDNSFYTWRLKWASVNVVVGI